MSEDQIAKLLAEIRDIQQQHLSFYQKTTERFVALQEQAMAAQRRHVVVHRVFVGIALALFATALYLVFNG